MKRVRVCLVRQLRKADVTPPPWAGAVPPPNNMIIKAARTFVCDHRFAVRRHGGDFAFVCRRCRLRKQELPVVRWRNAGKLIPFAAGALEPVPDRRAG